VEYHAVEVGCPVAHLGLVEVLSAQGLEGLPEERVMHLQVLHGGVGLGHRRAPVAGVAGEVVCKAIIGPFHPFNVEMVFLHLLLQPGERLAVHLAQSSHWLMVSVECEGPAAQQH
jgi:hypothetical protein